MITTITPGYHWDIDGTSVRHLADGSWLVFNRYGQSLPASHPAAKSGIDRLQSWLNQS